MELNRIFQYILRLRPVVQLMFCAGALFAICLIAYSLFKIAKMLKARTNKKNYIQEDDERSSLLKHIEVDFDNEMTDDEKKAGEWLDRERKIETLIKRGRFFGRRARIEELIIAEFESRDLDQNRFIQSDLVYKSDGSHKYYRDLQRQIHAPLFDELKLLNDEKFAYDVSDYELAALADAVHDGYEEPSASWIISKVFDKSSVTESKIGVEESKVDYYKRLFLAMKSVEEWNGYQPITSNKFHRSEIDKIKFGNDFVKNVEKFHRYRSWLKPWRWVYSPSGEVCTMTGHGADTRNKLKLEYGLFESEERFRGLVDLSRRRIREARESEIDNKQFFSREEIMKRYQGECDSTAIPFERAEEITEIIQQMRKILETRNEALEVKEARGWFSGRAKKSDKEPDVHNYSKFVCSEISDSEKSPA